MTAEADSLDSSLGITSLIYPMSPITLDTYYDTVIRGCGKKCPCRTWTQCHHYIDITEQDRRLRNKDNKIFEEIHEWYDNHFRLQYEYSDIFGNG